MRRCSQCNKLKDESEFYKEKKGNRFPCRCKECDCIKSKKYREVNKGICKERYLKYYKDHKEELKEYTRKRYLANSEYAKNYYQKNKERIKKVVKKYSEEHGDRLKELRHKAYIRHKDTLKYQEMYKNGTKRATKRLQTIPKYNLNNRMSCSIRKSLKEGKGGQTWQSLVGYTTDNLKNYIEKQFTEGMTWQKFLNGEIQIDHIIPKVLFNFEKPEDLDFKKCWSLSNLRPLWAEENRTKSSSYDGYYQPSFIF